MAVLDLDALAAGAALVELAQARRVAEDLLVERPHAARPDERLVVEAGWGERPAELVGHPHQVPVERAEEVLTLDDGSRADRLRADPHARDAVDRHLAVRAMTGAALQTTWAVVLEAPRKNASPLGEQR